MAQVKPVCTMVGAEAVRAYRGYSVPIEKHIVDIAPGPKLIAWLQEHDGEWDYFWTNSWDQPANAVASALKEFGVPIAVDVDDFFEGLPRGNVAHDSWVYERPRLYRAMLETADRRVASTPFLGEKYDAAVAPNFVNLEHWDYPKRPKADDSVTLLHCGSLNRAEDFLTQEGAFRAFLKQPNTKIIFMGWLPKWARDYEVGKVVYVGWVPYKEEPWGYKYNRMLRWLDPDIVVSPLLHNDFNLAKSNIKWLESAMIDACFVGEAWGELNRTVEQSHTGYLCSTGQEWRDLLVTLAQDEKMRSSASVNARSVVESQWTWGAVERLWRAALGG